MMQFNNIIKEDPDRLITDMGHTLNWFRDGIYTFLIYTDLVDSSNHWVAYDYEDDKILSSNQNLLSEIYNDGNNIKDIVLTRKNVYDAKDDKNLSLEKSIATKSDIYYTEKSMDMLLNSISFEPSHAKLQSILCLLRRCAPERSHLKCAMRVFFKVGEYFISFWDLSKKKISKYKQQLDDFFNRVNLPLDKIKVENRMISHGTGNLQSYNEYFSADSREPTKAEKALDFLKQQLHMNKPILDKKILDILRSNPKDANTLYKRLESETGMPIVKIKHLLGDVPLDSLKLSEGVDVDQNGKLVFDFSADSLDTPLKIYINRKDIRLKSKSDMRVSNIFYGFYFKTYNDIKNPTMERDDFNDKVNYIRTAIKSYPADMSDNIDKMIDAALNRFELVKPFKTLDVVVPLKSSSVLNDVIAKRINIKYGVEVIPELIVKNTIKNVKIEMPKTEKSENTKEYIDTIKSRMAAIPDEEFRSKMVPASFRRYFSNYLKFNDKYDISIFDKINGKNILVVDDTLGEGVTLREIQRLLYQYQPKSVFYFVLLKDY